MAVGSHTIFHQEALPGPLLKLGGIFPDDQVAATACRIGADDRDGLLRIFRLRGATVANARASNAEPRPTAVFMCPSLTSREKGSVI